MKLRGYFKRIDWQDLFKNKKTVKNVNTAQQSAQNMRKEWLNMFHNYNYFGESNKVVQQRE